MPGTHLLSACHLPSLLSTQPLVFPAIFPSRPIPNSYSTTRIFGSRISQSQWFSLSGGLEWLLRCTAWVSSHIWEPMPCPPSWFLPKTLSEHQAEMPGMEWQKDCVITSQEFVVKHPFIRAWNVGKQREVLKKKVMCLIKQQNIKVKGTQYRRAEGPRDRRLEDV